MTVAVVDEDGEILERYEYDAYGKPTMWLGDYDMINAEISPYGNPYYFTGRRVDEIDNGVWMIQYNRNRFYDYYTGCWLNQDPIGYQDGPNLYAYVGSNPVNFADSMGLFSESDRPLSRSELCKMGIGADCRGETNPDSNIDTCLSYCDTVRPFIGNYSYFICVAGCLAAETLLHQEPAPEGKGNCGGEHGVTVNIVSVHTTFGDYTNWWISGDDTYIAGTKRDKDGNIIKSAEKQIADILEDYSDCICELNLSGHGVPGCGISVENNYKSYLDEGLNIDQAGRIAKKLCKDAVVNICSCNSAIPDTQQLLANRLKATVCACDSTVSRRCSCSGNWICLNPNN